MITFPNAKINLGLNIVARRPDGYHEIETVFYPVPLCDALEIVPARGECTTLTCYGNKVDCPPESNLVMKACRLMQQHCSEVGPVDIYLYKHIPDGAGLGGGSSDAAHVLLMLNAMFALGLSKQELACMAAALGADCAFFIYNHPLMATGIGNVFSPAQVNLKGMTLLLVKPEVSVSTREAYARVTPAPAPEALATILNLPVSQWCNRLKNDFEPSVYAQYPSLRSIKSAIEQAGALYSCMSGSGSSIFGIFDSAIMAEQAARQFANIAHFVITLQA